MRSKLNTSLYKGANGANILLIKKLDIANLFFSIVENIQSDNKLQTNND